MCRVGSVAPPAAELDRSAAEGLGGAVPNHMKFCGCRMCRSGMRARMAAHVRRVVRRFRQRAKLALRRGQEPPACIGVGYTD